MKNNPQTLRIDGVDAPLLEQQRLALNAALDAIDTFGELRLTTAQTEALTGVLNRLDAWSDDQAAIQRETVPDKPRIAIILEGGVVQCVVSDDPESCEALVIDYDDSCDEDKITPIVQAGGAVSLAWVYDATPQAASIDLDALWREVYGVE